MCGVSSKQTELPPRYVIDEETSIGSDREESAIDALERLIDGELKLLAIYDARQASADTRTAALATAAIALPPLLLSLSKSFTSNAALLRVGYLVVVIAAIGILLVRVWNAWRTRPSTNTEGVAGGLHVSAEGAAVADARAKWRGYQKVKQVGQADPVRVRQLALEMWRTRADDSRRVAEIKDIMSVAAALLLAIALLITGILVVNAHFS
jgi:hypothetical protein